MAQPDNLSEFDLIKQYFVRQRPGRATLGIGDDCALLTPTARISQRVTEQPLHGHT